MNTRPTAVIYAVIGFLLISILTSCSGSSIIPDIRYPGFMYSSLARDTDPEADPAKVEQLTSDNASFAIDLYHQLIKTNDNLIFSPYSLSMALAMAYAGANPATKTEMENVLHFSLPEPDLHETFNALDLGLIFLNKAVDSDDGELTIKVANSFWVRKTLTVREPFLDTLMVNYGAGVGPMDLGNPQACADDINGWIEDMTEGKISNVINPNSIDALTLAYLVNAIYFYSNWAEKFDESNTRDEQFNPLSGPPTDVPMMHKTEHMAYYEGDGIKAVGIPYVIDAVKMVILLPDSGSFEDFEESLDANKLSEILDDMHNAEVRLSIPRFECRTSLELRDTLSEMGMPGAFTPGNDAFPDIFEPFSIGEGNTRIGRVIHEAFIEVNETGTEAAAATVIEFVTDSVSPDIEIMTFTADRPFIYLIVDTSTDNVLFLGRMIDPQL